MKLDELERFYCVYLVDGKGIEVIGLRNEIGENAFALEKDAIDRLPKKVLLYIFDNKEEAERFRFNRLNLLAQQKAVNFG